MRVRTFCLAELALLCAWLCLDLRASLKAETPWVLPLQLHVAEQDGKPVADEKFLASQVAHARKVFEQAAVDFVERERMRLPARHAVLSSRADRDALSDHVSPPAIHIMVVASLMDVDEPGRIRRGVHWTARKPPHKHFVIVSAISGPYVLAHELGHFLGNREHSDVAGNIMSYQLTDALPFFDADQKRRIAAKVEELVRLGELRPDGEPCAPD